MTIGTKVKVKVFGGLNLEGEIVEVSKKSLTSWPDFFYRIRCTEGIFVARKIDLEKQ